MLVGIDRNLIDCFLIFWWYIKYVIIYKFKEEFRDVRLWFLFIIHLTCFLNLSTMVMHCFYNKKRIWKNVQITPDNLLGHLNPTYRLSESII